VVLEDETGKRFRVTPAGPLLLPGGRRGDPEDLVHSADGALVRREAVGKNRYTAVRPVQPLATA